MTAEIYIAGHSLGAAEAYEYAYSRIMRGLRVDGIYAFAPPRPGDSAIGKAIAGVPVVRALKNRRDIITAIPIDIAWLGEEYVQPVVLEEIDEKPQSSGPFADHAMTLYLAGAQKLPPRGVTIEIGAAAQQVNRLYDDPTGWDWINLVNGRYWAMKVMPSGAKLMLRRGTQTALDLLDDVDAIMVPVHGARMSRGFWAGVEPIEAQLDQQLA